jgi:hypothetical protein
MILRMTTGQKKIAMCVPGMTMMQTHVTVLPTIRLNHGFDSVEQIHVR